VSIETIKVPDIGGSDDVEVIEICVAVGDQVEKEDSLLVLESDKASMEIPSPSAGTVKSIKVSNGDSLSMGDIILELETSSSSSEVEDKPAPVEAEAVPEPKQTAASEPEVSTSTSVETINVPDVGGATDAEVIEICVNVGDEVEEGDSLIVLETDKASMEVPAPKSGKVVSITINNGDTAAEGVAILELAVTGSGTAPVVEAQTVAETKPVEASPEPVASAPQTETTTSVETVTVPDIGGATDVDVIEVCVNVGDEVEEGDSLIVLETDKASMEVPALKSGKVISLAIKEGDSASLGTAILDLEVTGTVAAPQAAPQAPVASKPAAPAPSSHKVSEPAPQASKPAADTTGVYAGPAVRMLARELGVDVAEVKGTGPRNRITKDDLKAFVKDRLSKKSSAAPTTGSGIPAIPAVDFSQFGDITIEKLSKIARVTAANMQRNWLNVPHVTQFDDADISELEDFRASLKAEAEKRGVKITPLPFILKAVAAALKAHPKFNSSLHSDGENIVYKHYINIGMAVDTPAGLMVPVIKDVDKKSIWDLAAETVELAGKAKDRKLKPIEMQGACFTISSLGGIGGQGFTPIVNAPEVGILGISKLAVKPVWNGSEFLPRKMLPLCLSYDHRAINGGDAGRFLTYLTQVLADIRLLVL
jgi:pyruvate dehydrogenase E2 component (dihydrolipoamide acetyltransferase)